MSATIILRGDSPGEDRAVFHKGISPDYRSPLPDFEDEHGQVWGHVNPQAWAPPDRRIPVYDRIELQVNPRAVRSLRA
jgi:hypothetical protein